MVRAERQRRKRNVGDFLHNLGELDYEDGNYAWAEDNFRSALGICYELQLWMSVVRGLNALARLELARGRFRRAAQLFGAAISLARRHSVRLTQDDLMKARKSLNTLRSLLPRDDLRRAMAIGGRLEDDAAVKYAVHAVE